jgi:hypothetical protein
LLPYIMAQIAGGLVALELFKRVKLWSTQPPFITHL